MAQEDYYVDPFQAEEEEIKAKALRAQALGLRMSGNPIIDATYAGMDRSQAAWDQSNVTQMRKELSEKRRKALAEATRGMSPQNQEFMKDPTTRALAIEDEKQRAKYRLQEERRAARNASRGGRMPPSGDPTEPTAAGFTRAELNEMLTSPDKDEREIAKELLATLKGQDPKHNVFYGDNGAAVNPVAARAFVDQTRQSNAATVEGKDADVEIPLGGGMIFKGPRSEAMRRGYPVPAGNALPATNPQGYGAGGGAPATGVPSAPGGGVSGPNMPVNGASPGALPASRGALEAEGFPQAQPRPQDATHPAIPKLMQLFQQESAAFAKTRDPQHAKNVQQIGEALAGYGVDLRTPQGQGALKQTMAATQQSAPPSVAPAQPQGASPPQAAPGGPALPQTMGVGQPAGQMGVSDPLREGAFTDIDKTMNDVTKAAQAKKGNIGKVFSMLGRLEELNAKPTFSGRAGPFKQEFSAWTSGIAGQDPSAKVDNTDTLESAIENIKGPMLKEYGFNPSNIDLYAAAARLPRVGQSPQARNMILQEMKNATMNEMKIDQQAMQMYNELKGQGRAVDLQQITDKLWYDYNMGAEERRKAQGAGNPTPAGGASALPGARKAAEDRTMKFPDFLNPDPRVPGGGLFRFAEDLIRNKDSLGPSVISGSGVDAFKDSWGNDIEGGKELFGFGDRKAAMEDLQRQAQRREEDPAYNQARVLADSTSPKGLILARARGVPSLVAGGAAQGALHPASGLGEQGLNALKGAGLNTAIGAATRGLPSTRLADSINIGGEGDELLKQFPEFKPGSSQMNPDTIGSKLARGVGVEEARYLDNAKAITTNLMKRADIPGEQLTPRNIALAKSDHVKQDVNMIPKGAGVKVSSVELDQLNAMSKIIPENELQKLPMWSMINRTTSDVIGLGTRLNSVEGKNLYTAWKEIAKSGLPPEEIQRVRDALEGIITKGNKDIDVSKFAQLEEKGKILRDIEHVWGGGAHEGVGSSSGFLSPSKIVTEAKATQSQAVKDAARLINKFMVRNANVGVLEPSMMGITKTGLSGVGKLLNYADRTMPQASESTKNIIDLLRQAPRSITPYATQQFEE